MVNFVFTYIVQFIKMRQDGGFCTTRTAWNQNVMLQICKQLRCIQCMQVWTFPNSWRSCTLSNEHQQVC